jgi:cell wall-associated NlpC family hydrolase
VLLALGACAHPGGVARPPGYETPTDTGVAANGVLMRAIGLVGTPYRYGGNSPAGGFDCSGLVQFVYLDSAGIRLPRSTRELVAMQARHVHRDDLRPGDLVFFNPGGGNASHIGIYVGDGRFVHAPATGGTVRLDRLDAEYWRRTYSGARRIL